MFTHEHSHLCVCVCVCHITVCVFMEDRKLIMYKINVYINTGIYKQMLECIHIQ